MCACVFCIQFRIYMHLLLIINLYMVSHVLCTVFMSLACDTEASSLFRKLFWLFVYDLDYCTIAQNFSY